MGRVREKSGPNGLVNSERQHQLGEQAAFALHFNLGRTDSAQRKKAEPAKSHWVV